MSPANRTAPKAAQTSSNIVLLPIENLGDAVERLASREGLVGLLRQQEAMLEILNVELSILQALAARVSACPEASSSEEVRRIKEDLVRAASTLAST